MLPLEQAVHAALSRVIDPEIRKPITELGMVESIRADGDHLDVTILLTVATCPAAERIRSDVRSAIEATSGVSSHTLTVGVMSPEQRAAFVTRARGDGAERTIAFGPESRTRIIAVTSGKGGVGKSTLAANLAVACAKAGASVGMIDADVHGYSIPGILGLPSTAREGRPTRIDNMIVPPVAHDVKTISIGMFLDPEKKNPAIAWRGPMLHRTLHQFLRDVYFGELDLLFIDLPPGTGDMAISFGQLLPHAEVIVVTTPQPSAATVAERSGAIAHQSGQQLLGVIENMSGPAAAGAPNLFGQGGGALTAERLSRVAQAPVPLLASVPLSHALRADGDAGTPAVLRHPEDPAARAIKSLATEILNGTSRRRRRLPITPVNHPSRTVA